MLPDGVGAKVGETVALYVVSLTKSEEDRWLTADDVHILLAFDKWGEISVAQLLVFAVCSPAVDARDIV